MTKKFFVCLVLLTGSAIFGHTVKAQSMPVENAWLCYTCITPAQFEALAISNFPGGAIGTYRYAVANPNTLEFRYVTVYHGTVVWSDNETSDSVVGTASMADALPAATSSLAASSTRASSAVEEEFGVMVALSRGDFLVAAPSHWWGLESFHGKEMAQVSQLLHGFLAEHHSGWTRFAMSAGPWGFLAQALKLHEGKGPTVCVVFQNGDSACFQMNPYHTPAMYIQGTAQDAHGNSLHEEGGVGSGGGESLQIVHEPPTIGWGRTSGELWLFCATVNGVLSHCWTEIR